MAQKTKEERKKQKQKITSVDEGVVKRGDMGCYLLVRIRWKYKMAQPLWKIGGVAYNKILFKY